jgi:hypothetical protein
LLATEAKMREGNSSHVSPLLFSKFTLPPT